MTSAIQKLIQIYTDAIEYIKPLPHVDGYGCEIIGPGEYNNIMNVPFMSPDDWENSLLGNYIINNSLTAGICEVARTHDLFRTEAFIDFVYDFTAGRTYLTGTPWLCNKETVLKLLQYRLDRLIEFKDWTPKQI